MSSRLTELPQEDSATIAAKPRRSELLEKHLPDSGGYLFYSLLSNAGVHPGAGRSQAFYGRPGKAVIDFDFKGLHAARRDGGKHRTDSGEVDCGRATIPDASLTDIKASKLSAMSIEDSARITYKEM